MVLVYPPVIIIGGVCGSGKTTVGMKIGKIIGYRFLDADDFHTDSCKLKMGRGEPLDDADRMSWLRRLSSAVEPGGKFVIACSALKAKYRTELMKGELAGRQMVFVMLKVTEDELRRRLENRTNHFAKSDLVESQLATLELPPDNASEPEVFVIDALGPVDEITAEVLQRISLSC